MLVLLIGIQGSGKSTFLSSLRGRYHVVSPDDIRDEFPGMGNKRVFSIARKRAKKALESGRYKAVFIDATNIIPAWRKVWIDLAQELEVPLGYITFSVPLETAKERVSKRAQNGGRYVPPEVIEKYYKMYKSASMDDLKAIGAKKMRKEDF